MKKMRFEPPPLTVRSEAPGPLMVRLLVIIGSGVARAIVPVTEKLMVAVSAAPRIAWRKEPEPALLVVVTVRLLAVNVVKLRSEPRLTPAVLLATTRK